MPNNQAKIAFIVLKTFKDEKRGNPLFLKNQKFRLKNSLSFYNVVSRSVTL